MLGFNFYLIKNLADEAIGLFYLTMTMSYIGNAFVFVGCDLFIQRKLVYLQDDFSIHQESFFKFIFATSVIGILLITLFSSLFFISIQPSSIDVVLGIASCCFLSLSVYYGNLIKNLFQLANKQYKASFFQIFDACLKFSVFIYIFHTLQPDEKKVQVSILTYSVILVIVSLSFMLAAFKNNVEHKWRIDTIGQVTSRILPIGFSGVLNWVQLQGYRPYLAAIQAQKELGIVSYMTSLASTATASVLSVINQIAIPKIYQSSGEYIHFHLKVILFVSLIISVCSIPAGYLFFLMANKLSYTAYLYILPIGVLQEAVNAVIGAYTHVFNVRDNKLSVFVECSGLGSAVVIFSLLYDYMFGSDKVLLVCLAILVSQLTVCGYVIYKASKGYKCHVTRV